MPATGMTKKKALLGTGAAVAGLALTTGAVLLGGLGGSATVDSASAQPGPCHTTMLSASVHQDPGSAGMGHTGATLSLRNISDQTCTMDGYPALQLLKGGYYLPTNVVDDHSTAPEIVTLIPNASATTSLYWDYDIPTQGEPTNGPCEASPTDLSVVPPSGSMAVLAKWDLGPVCEHGRIEVGPFHGQM